MRTFAIIVLPSIAAAIFCYWIANFVLNLPDAIATGIASIFLLAIGPVYDIYEKRQTVAKIARQHPKSIPLPNERRLTFMFVLPISIFMMAGTGPIGGAISGGLLGFAAAATGWPFPPPVVILLNAIPYIAILVYFVGRWIGKYAYNYGAAICIVSPMIGKTGLTSLYLLDPEILIRNDPSGISPLITEIQVLYAALEVIVIYIPVALIAYYRSIRLREAQYLRFLLTVLPVDSRTALVHIAQEEAQRAAVAKD